MSNVTSYFATPAPGLRSTDNRSALILAHTKDHGDVSNPKTKPLIATLTGMENSAVSVQAGGGTGTGIALSA